jgi:hypothetical protein
LPPRLLHCKAIKLAIAPVQPTSSCKISHRLPASFPTTEEIERDIKIDLENRRELLSLRGVISPSLLVHGVIQLDHVGGHARAPAKPHELGVYDSGRVGYLSYARRSYVPCSSGGIHHGMCGVL